MSRAIKSRTIAEENDAPVYGASVDGTKADGAVSIELKPPTPGSETAVSAETSSVAPQADALLVHLDQFHSDPRFAGLDGHGLSVVVIDTGIDLDHPFFGPDADHNGVADRIVYSYDFSDSNDADASDTQGHGSNVASIVGSQDGTYTGMAPGVNIIALKVFPDSGAGATVEDISEALDWVVANLAAYDIVAVNMSLGFGDNENGLTPSPWASQFATLAAAGAAVVVASGNAYASYQVQGVSSPSSDPNAWSIGAVWDRTAGGSYFWSGGSIDFSTGPDQITSFSQRSATLTTVFAPGGQITGANWNGGTITYSGTSQATPHVAGLVADMQQLALQVSGHFLSEAQLEADMIAGSVTIFDGDDENDSVANSGASYHRVDALGWGIQVLADLFAGTSGIDTLNGTPVGDSIAGAAGSDILSGNAGNDTLDGGAGNDALDGGAGADTMSGGIGNDSYVVDNAADQVLEAAGEGADTIFASVNFTLAAGQEVESLRAGGSAGFTLTGNDLDNRLVGGAGADTLGGAGGNDQLEGGGGNDALNGGAGNDHLNGGAGADAMSGGTGNDIYIVDDAGDRVIEAIGEGSDLVYAVANYTLGAGQGVESLRVGGSAGLTLTGNELNNQLVGGAAADTLNGAAGSDQLEGGSA
ncbi:MAG TPA: S8 family serine peptidase, partial [Reyranella sp.]|nr:S8 family serine peptidase [Reyranella sp.]